MRLGLQVRGVTSRDELHNDEPLALRLEDVLEGDDVRVAAHAAEDLHLVVRLRVRVGDRLRVGVGARLRVEVGARARVEVGVRVSQAAEDPHLVQVRVRARVSGNGQWSVVSGSGQWSVGRAGAGARVGQAAEVPPPRSEHSCCLSLWS